MWGVRKRGGGWRECSYDLVSDFAQAGDTIPVGKCGMNKGKCAISLYIIKKDSALSTRHLGSRLYCAQDIHLWYSEYHRSWYFVLWVLMFYSCTQAGRNMLLCPKAALTDGRTRFTCPLLGNLQFVVRGATSVCCARHEAVWYRDNLYIRQVDCLLVIASEYRIQDVHSKSMP